MEDQNQIIVFDHKNFEGPSRTFTEEDCDHDGIINLGQKSFSKVISSIKVIGQPWILYNYDPRVPQSSLKDTFTIFEEGNYSEIELDNVISHMLFIDDDLSSPKIELFKFINFKGDSITAEGPINLLNSDITRSNSCKVERGAWILNSEYIAGLKPIIVRTGQHNSEYSRNKFYNTDAHHVRPLKAGRQIVSTELIWEKKEESVKTIVIDTFSGINRSDVEHRFNAIKSKEYRTEMTNCVKFERDTKIKAGAEFTIDFGAVESSVSASFSRRFAVTKGEKEMITNTSTHTVELPVTIQPHTELLVKVVKKEIDIVIPVKLIINHSKKYQAVETAYYKSSGGVAIDVEFVTKEISVE
ncbi:putative beta/gamma crystallin domain-containing protein [Namao virus]|nr:putative beta/gamma crystallin domain-containing protein [Namao virus]